jgi:hypothetical protein
MNSEPKINIELDTTDIMDALVQNELPASTLNINMLLDREDTIREVVRAFAYDMLCDLATDLHHDGLLQTGGGEDAS